MPFDTGAYLNARAQGDQAIAGIGGTIADTINQYTALTKKTKAYRAMAVDGLGMDPEQVDKMDLSTLEGKFQGAALKRSQAEAAAKTAEVQQRTQLMQQQQDEGDAMSSIAPAAQAWAAKNPGKQPSPTDFMGMMAAAGPVNLRVQAAMVRKFMGGDAGQEQPQFVTSPSGNSYAYMGNSMMADRAPMDAAELRWVEGYDAVPDGKGGVKYLNQKDTTPKLPPTFEPTMNTYAKQVADAQTTLSSPDTDFASPAIAKMTKSAATRKLTSAQKQAQSLLDRHLKSGALTPDAHAAMYQDLGLTPPAASSTPAGSSSPGTGAAAASSKAALANQIAAQNPTWTREQVIAAVNQAGQ